MEKSLRTSAASLRLGGERLSLLALGLLLVIAGSLRAPTTLAQSKPKRPNIVFIQTDDQAAWALGISRPPSVTNVHSPGEQARTPAYWRSLVLLIGLS